MFWLLYNNFERYYYFLKLGEGYIEFLCDVFYVCGFVNILNLENKI